METIGIANSETIVLQLRPFHCIHCCILDKSYNALIFSIRKILERTCTDMICPTVVCWELFLSAVVRIRCVCLSGNTRRYTIAKIIIRKLSQCSQFTHGQLQRHYSRTETRVYL